MMLNKNIKRIIVTKNNELIGIVTISDIIDVVMELV